MRVLIVDDEPLARARLRGLLSRVADVEIVGEAATSLLRRFARFVAARSMQPEIL